MKNYTFNWEPYVFICYFFVLLFLAVYAYFSFKVRADSLKNLQDEGFVENEDTNE
ncbi:MAG: hypothetical protein K2X39_10220 [Silvanigrellaceae bacterium]|nr:hypothetical protein [Silvanigrellaceae bacterium]